MRRSIQWVASAALIVLFGVSATTSPATPLAASTTARTEVAGLDEMLRDSKGQLQYWSSVPELVVLTSVMQYHNTDAREYVATSELLTAKDTQSLVADLTLALRQLTDNTFEEFATIRYEAVPAGSTAAIVRPKQIVVGRFQGLTDLAHTIGFGGRSTRRGEIVGAAILLDSEFDRTSGKRRLSRTHELGHALGFNHVRSRVSIMNERIGPEVTDVDRQLGLLAFQRPTIRTAE
jgi:hypothetical protein